LAGGGTIVTLAILYMWKYPPSNPTDNLKSKEITTEHPPSHSKAEELHEQIPLQSKAEELPAQTPSQSKAEEPKGTILWEIYNSSKDTWNESKVYFKFQDADGKDTSSVELSRVIKPTETLSVYPSDLRSEYQSTAVRICKIVCLIFKTDKGETVRANLKKASNGDCAYCQVAATEASDNYKAKDGYVKFRGIVTV
jgi:hypothetical protein